MLEYINLFNMTLDHLLWESPHPLNYVSPGVSPLTPSPWNIIIPPGGHTTPPCHILKDLLFLFLCDIRFYSYFSNILSIFLYTKLLYLLCLLIFYNLMKTGATLYMYNYDFQTNDLQSKGWLSWTFGCVIMHTISKICFKHMLKNLIFLRQKNNY